MVKKTYARGVPAGNLGGTADVGEVGDGALGLVAVAGDEAVGAVGARDGDHGAAGVIVAGVVGDWWDVLVMLHVVGMESVMRHTSDGGGSGGQGEDAEDVGEHFEGWWGLLGWFIRGWYVYFTRGGVEASGLY